jgi:hypothetical protein
MRTELLIERIEVNERLTPLISQRELNRLNINDFPSTERASPPAFIRIDES